MGRNSVEQAGEFLQWMDFGRVGVGKNWKEEPEARGQQAAGCQEARGWNPEPSTRVQEAARGQEPGDQGPEPITKRSQYFGSTICKRWLPSPTNQGFV